MARIARRLTGALAIELEHPLRLWQREVFSPASVAQARLLLVDIAVERGRAGEADLTTIGDHEPYGGNGLRQSIGRWRSVAAGVAVGDAGCLIAFARGLAGERSERRLGDDSLDATLTALALATRAGTAPERIVACVETLLMLPEIIGRSSTIARRARALAALFRSYRALRWSASARSARDQYHSISVMMEALATVEASAIWRGVFTGDLDREALSGRMADLVAAVPLAPGDDAVVDDEPFGGGCDTDLPPSARRTGLTRTWLEMGPPVGSLDRPLSVTPFPNFDAARLSDSRKVMSDRFAILKTPLPLTPVASRQALDGPFRELTREMPNFRMVIERINDELALARCTSSQGALRLPPLLLVGPPGVGKTRFAARLAACLGLPWSCLALAGSSDSRELAGTARGWSSAHPGWPVEQLVQLGSANPMLVIDEIDKAGGSDRNGRASMSLLTLLERRTSRTYHDECLGGPIDLSGISWICTANSTTGLPEPLLSRLIVAIVPAPDADQVGVLLDTMREEIAAERGIRDPRMLPVLPQSAVELLRQGYAAHGDPRRLRAELVRILATAARAEELWIACPASNLH